MIFAESVEVWIGPAGEPQPLEAIAAWLSIAGIVSE